MLRCLLLALSVVIIGACSNESSSSPAEGSTADGSATKSLTPSEALNRPRPKTLRPPPKLNTTRPPFALSASHILIQYKGATKATTTRTKAEAKKLAEKVLAQAKSGEVPFHVLARENSDAPDKAAGGYLGIFRPWKQYPQFNKAVASVGFDEIVPAVIETDLGYHVVKREKTIHLGHVLVMYKGCRSAHTGITRDREEAQAEAERLRKLLMADGADREAIARKTSDCPLTKAVGGDLGYYGRGAKSVTGGRLLPKLIPAVIGLEPGEVSKVTESEFGFHVVWRYPDPARGELGETETHDGDAGAQAADDAGPGPAKQAEETQ